MDYGNDDGTCVQGHELLLARTAALLAHELGNPLAAVSSMLQSLRQQADRIPRNQLREELERALAELTRLNTLVRSYLSMVRPKPESVPVLGLAEVVDRTFADLAELVDDAGVTIQREPIPDGLLVLFGEDQFKQVVWNVVKNALDSMSSISDASHRPLLRVVTENVVSGHVDLCFEDNGKGIDEDAALRAFEPFYTSKGSAGTGLGLTVARMLARRFDSTLTLERVDPRGARARLRMRRGPE